MQLSRESTTLCMLGNFPCFCGRLLVFFQNKLFQKILSGTLSECQTVRIQIGTDAMSVLIWVQTACKIYQQTTKIAASKERVSVAIIPENVQNTKNVQNCTDFQISCN